MKGNTQKWFNCEVLEKLNLRNKLFKKFKKSRLHIDKESNIKWFKSYLSERIFLVTIENKLSHFTEISCGVPQGFILGPLLFLIYVNDMPQAVTSTLLLYADHSCIL